MKLRIYVGIFLLIFVFIAFCLLAIENQRRTEEIRHLKIIIDQQERKAMPAPPPLPVCAKGERHPWCRPLAADETGATIRGVRDETSND